MIPYHLLDRMVQYGSRQFEKCSHQRNLVPKETTPRRNGTGWKRRDPAFRRDGNYHIIVSFVVRRLLALRATLRVALRPPAPRAVPLRVVVLRAVRRGDAFLAFFPFLDFFLLLFLVLFLDFFLAIGMILTSSSAFCVVSVTAWKT